MKKYIPTIHSKMRYSQRVGYRKTMDDTVHLALKYGVRLEDIPKTKENERLRSFIQRDKIYFKGRIYIFANQGEYKTLITVYYTNDKTLEKILNEKVETRKRKLYRQIFTTQNSELYTIIFYKGRVVELKKVKKRVYQYNVLEDKQLIKRTTLHLYNLLRGKKSNYDINLYFGDFTELEEKVYKKIIEIPLGETLTYKFLADTLGITVQKLTRTIKSCPIPIFIPTHRVIKSNGQVGSYIFTKEVKKTLLLNEKSNSGIIQIKKDNVVINTKDEYFCYSIGDLIKLSE